MEFLASKYISTFNFFFLLLSFFQFKLISRVNLPETGNKRRVPAWLIPESSWWSAWWWWWWCCCWFREFWTGSVGWCCRVHGNSMTEGIFRGCSRMENGGGEVSQEHTKTLGHYIITYPKNRNPWLEIREIHSAISITSETSVLLTGKKRKERGGKGKISLLASEESNLSPNTWTYASRVQIFVDLY